MGKEVRENRRTFCCAALYVQISNCLPKNVQSSIHFVCSKAKGSTNNCECVMYGWPLAKWPETLFITASRPLAIPAAVLHTVQICTRNGGLGLDMILEIFTQPSTQYFWRQLVTLVRPTLHSLRTNCDKKAHEGGQERTLTWLPGISDLFTYWII